jgi:hypothetical protein
MIDDVLYPAATEDGAVPELDPTAEPGRDRRWPLVAAGTAVAVGLAGAGWGLVAGVASVTSSGGFPDVHGLHAGSAINVAAVAARVDPYVVDHASH